MTLWRVNKKARPTAIIHNEVAEKLKCQINLEAGEECVKNREFKIAKLEE